MEVYKIGEFIVFLEDLGLNKGKIIISSAYGGNYSYFWGAMGSDIKKFITSINPDYFASKLVNNYYEYSPKKTMRNVRKFIREELGLNWYNHLEFQKDMREKIKYYFSNCENADSFVISWGNFVTSLNYYLIDNKFKRESIEEDFKNVSEVWYLIGEDLTNEYKMLVKLHNDLIKSINKKDYKILIEA